MVASVQRLSSRTVAVPKKENFSRPKFCGTPSYPQVDVIGRVTFMVR